MRISLKDFLLTGKLGMIALGITREEISRSLGEALDWTFDVPKARATLWKYGGLQIGFDNDKVTLMGMYFSNEFIVPNVELEGYFPTGHTTSQEFMDFLRSEKIDYQVDASLTFGPQLCLVVASGVQSLFDSEVNHLISIQYADH